MLRHTFLGNIASSVLMLDASGRETLNSIIASLHRGIVPEMTEYPVVSYRGEILSLPEEDEEAGNPFDRWSAGSIALIPLSGIMMKQTYRWWGYGTDDVARMIRLAYE